MIVAVANDPPICPLAPPRSYARLQCQPKKAAASAAAFALDILTFVQMQTVNATVPRDRRLFSLLMNHLSDLTIDGVFEGTDKETVFRLSNGQVWQQLGHSLRYTFSLRPRVRIDTTGRIVMMHVEGFGRPIPVRRVR